MRCGQPDDRVGFEGHRSGAQHGNPKFTAWAALCAIFVDSSKGNVLVTNGVASGRGIASLARIQCNRLRTYTSKIVVVSIVTEPHSRVAGTGVICSLGSTSG